MTISKETLNACILDILKFLETEEATNRHVRIKLHENEGYSDTTLLYALHYMISMYYIKQGIKLKGYGYPKMRLTAKGMEKLRMLRNKETITMKTQKIPMQILRTCDNCGRRTIRKTCLCKYHNTPVNSKVRRLAQKRYYEKNKNNPNYRATRKRYYEKNKENAADRWQKYHTKNKDKINAKKRETYWANIKENRRINREKARKNQKKKRSD